MIEQPLFLVGSERSGTTLLRLMLDHHSDITWLYEFEYCVDCVSDQGDYPSLTDFYEFLERDRMFQGSNFSIDRNLSYPQLVDDFLQQKQAMETKNFLGATVHRHFDRLLHIWSDARFVHLIRDPRDVARSCIGMGWTGNVWYGVDRWIEAEKTWNNLKSKISDDRYIEIHYEDLICEPEKTLTSICQFIGVNYETSMLDYDRDTTYSKPDPSLIQQWRKKLSEFEVQLVELKVGDSLTEKDYQPSGFPKIQVNSLKLKQLSLQDWWYRVNFRINRYGLSLFISDYLARKLKMKSWQKENQLKMGEIANQYVK